MPEEVAKQPAELVASAKSILIVVRRNPLTDTLASAVALYMALKKAGKQVNIITPRPLTVEYGTVIGADEVKNEVGARNLVLSWDYEEGKVEKVNYYVKNGKFYFTVQPKIGQKPFTADKVQFSYSGADADLIIALGTQVLDQLEKIYTQEKEFFSTVPVINIDKDRNNGNYGSVNIVDTHAASVAEVIVDFIRDLELPVDADIATNLLTGLIDSTDNFQKPTTTARTFEAAAACLQAGARRIPKVNRQQVTNRPITNRPNMQQRTEVKLQLENKPEEKNIEEVEKEVTEPSPDWLKPKIYKGSSEV